MVHINRVATIKEVSDEKAQFETVSSINLHPEDDDDDYTATVYGSKWVSG